MEQSEPLVRNVQSVTPSVQPCVNSHQKAAGPLNVDISLKAIQGLRKPTATPQQLCLQLCTTSQAASSAQPNVYLTSVKPPKDVERNHNLDGDDEVAPGTELPKLLAEAPCALGKTPEAVNHYSAEAYSGNHAYGAPYASYYPAANPAPYGPAPYYDGHSYYYSGAASSYYGYDPYAYGQHSHAYHQWPPHPDSFGSYWPWAPQGHDYVNGHQLQYPRSHNVEWNYQSYGTNQATVKHGLVNLLSSVIHVLVATKEWMLDDFNIACFSRKGPQQWCTSRAGEPYQQSRHTPEEVPPLKKQRLCRNFIAGGCTRPDCHFLHSMVQPSC